MADLPDIPMPPDRFAELLARRQQREAAAVPDALPPDRDPPPPVSTPFAQALLAESSRRILEAGELLVLFEEAAVVDLGQAAGPIPRLASWQVLAPPPDVVLPRSLTEVLTPGAWLLSDRVRRLVGRTPSAGAWLRAAAAVVAGGVPVTADLVIGHLETFPERLDTSGACGNFTRARVACARSWCGNVPIPRNSGTRPRP